VAALAGAAVYGWRVWFPNDEAQIHAVLERIADGISGDGEGDARRLARAASLLEEFDPDVTVDAGPPFDTLRGRDVILGAAAKMNGSVRNLDLSFDDVVIQVDAVRSQATANLTAEARFDDGGGAAVDARELDVSFTRIDGAWVVSAVTLVRPLRRLDQP